MIFAGAGYHVIIHDVSRDQLDSGMETIRRQLADMERLGCLRGSSTVSEQCDLITTTTDLAECVSGAIYVQVGLTKPVIINVISIYVQVGLNNPVIINMINILGLTKSSEYTNIHIYGNLTVQSFNACVE
jgi:hypothetical protein